MNLPKTPETPQPPRPMRRPGAPAPPAATAVVLPAPGVAGDRRVPFGALALLLTAAAVALAAALADLLTRWLELPAAWAAPLAAAAALAAAAVPLGILMLRLSRDAEPGRNGAGDGVAAGIPRPLFMDLAGREWARARRYGTGAAMLLVDVDRYARLGEARGPGAGHAVLRELLRQTGPTLRTADVLTRYGESQMAVFLAQADATGALDVAERIRERAEHLEVACQPDVHAQPLRITVSVGVAHLRPAHLNLQSLVDDAEEATAAARQSGGNCVRAAPVATDRPRLPGNGHGERRARPNHGGTPS